MKEALKAHFQKLRVQNRNLKIAEKIDYMMSILEQEETNQKEVIDAFEEIVLSTNKQTGASARSLIYRDRTNRRIFAMIKRLSISEDHDCGCQ